MVRTILICVGLMVLSGCATRDAIIVHNTIKNARGISATGVQEELRNRVMCMDPARRTYCR